MNKLDADDLNNLYWAIQELNSLNGEINSRDFGLNYKNQYEQNCTLIKKARKSYENIRNKIANK